MATWVKIGEPDEVAPGRGLPFETEAGEIAVFNVDGEFYAIDNDCPHEAAPLGRGKLSGTVVTCPGHGLRYDVTTGLKPGTNSGVRAYAIDVRDDGLYVEVDVPAAATNGAPVVDESSDPA